VYIEQSGPGRRETSKGRRLQVSPEYVERSIGAIIDFESTLNNLVAQKYQAYTKVAAHRRLWSFLFDSPVMRFDGFWRYDEEEDSILAFKKGKYEEQLSRSETIMLGLWRAHFNGDTEYLRNFNMRSFDPKNQEKVLFFLSIAPDFSFE